MLYTTTHNMEEWEKDLEDFDDPKQGISDKIQWDVMLNNARNKAQQIAEDFKARLPEILKKDFL